jgi:hypothetical protein
MKSFTVRQFEAAVDEKVIASGISGPDHHSVFHDLLCIQRHPLTGSFLLRPAVKNGCFSWYKILAVTLSPTLFIRQENSHDGLVV